MMSWLLFILGVLSLGATVTALVRIHKPTVLGFFVMMTSWLTGEYPGFHVGWQAVVAALLVYAGGLQGSIGVVGLVVLVVSWVGLGVVLITQTRARPSAGRALRGTLGDDYLERLPSERRAVLRTHVPLAIQLLPLFNNASGIVRERDIAYGDHPKRHLLDVYRPESSTGPLPVVIQIHGGGWVIGHKRQQGMPLVHRLAGNGYVAVSINYRLGPKYRFPEQLIDVKRAIAWTREHIAEYGGDPRVIILTGGSAGGHLSALAALTPNQPEYQPGFESSDTSVTACMPFYGPTDFTDGDGIRGRMDAFEIFLERTVMPGSMKDVPDLYRAMSPINHVRPDAPPFLIIQGGLDVLVWREENRRFAELLAEASEAPVVYWEVPGAQHAFDTFNSRRSAIAVDTCEQFAGWVVADVSVPNSTDG
jgi:acetyl esterase/lipase